MGRTTEWLKLGIATLGGAGTLPGAPGTWGSLASILLLWPIALTAGIPGLLAATLASSLLCLWVADDAEQAWGVDPPKMVIDEFAGQAVVLLWLPLRGDLPGDLLWLLAAFLLFRLFDIIKPLGIARLQHFPSGFGILLDDLLAGFYALACLQSGIWLMAMLS